MTKKYMIKSIFDEFLAKPSVVCWLVDNNMYKTLLKFPNFFKTTSNSLTWSWPRLEIDFTEGENFLM